MARRRIVAGLDVGTSKVAVVVGEIAEQEEVRVIGVGEARSSGLRKGMVVDIDSVAKAIQSAVEKAEQMSGHPIETVYAGITGAHIASFNNRGVVAISRRNREITVEDVHRVLQAAQIVPVPPDHEIIHVIPREYIVDGHDGIMDPVAMSGTRLEVEASIVTGIQTAIQNLLKSVSRAGLQVEELVLNPLAAAETVMQPAEKELGAVLIDIGGGTTEIALFDEGTLWYTAVLPVGGDLVTSDLAVGLRTPLAQAEEIKKKHGCVLAELMPSDELVEIPNVGKQEFRRVSRKTIASIIEPRILEILALIKERIYDSGYKGMLPGGVVLTGGVASMDGLVELAAEELQMPVRVGLPGKIGGLTDMVNFGSYATVTGLVLYGARQVALTEAAPTADPLLGGFMSKLRLWLRDFFN
ncbi:actin-like ATPase [Calderihabitans maritimus]|uniref:Cell division protein FtsA n=1 Tax=Calderihabitans maritimus TaxID=1246530 RepID=A0A1Z5HRI8_9FIRM|nr:cell division protein FtsA [Calderihabitans maritimus]GAW92139.1 actin-like ATPase [Calderihabitans maritimus]